MSDPSADTRQLPRLLIVDDDPLIAETLGFVLGREFDVVTAGSRTECIERLRNMDRTPDLALVDLGLPPTPHRPDQGLALISDLLAHAPGIRIVVLSGQDLESSARHARAMGAAEFVAKPADPQELRRTLNRVLAFDRIDEGARSTAAEGCGLVGESLPMQKLRAQIGQYAESPFPVLIEGESGSGKDIVASCCLHRLTTRHDKPFLALNCAAISPTLVEPTLFGYAKGSFTGAAGARSGYFEDAADGTLFLDEIGELPLDLQPKLLRVLENGEYQRVGETQLRIARCRVVAATNRDLRREVKSGRFRADLYHRLSVFAISVPPLREMGRDRVLLLDHYRRIYAAQSGRPPFALTPEALQVWEVYRFPGNVRELRNIVIRLTAKFAGASVGVRELETELDPQEEGGGDRADAAIPVLPQNSADLSGVALAHLRQAHRFELDGTLRLWEQAYIDAAMLLTQGNVSQAAKLLGINRTTLYNRIGSLARGAPAEADLRASGSRSGD